MQHRELIGAKRLSSLEHWLHTGVIVIGPGAGIWIGVAHGIPRAIGFYFVWYAAVRLLAGICNPYINEDGSWFGIGLSIAITMLERGRMTGEVAWKTGLSIAAWFILPWALALCFACIDHWPVPVLGGLLFVVWRFSANHSQWRDFDSRPTSLEPPKPSDSAEQKFRRMKELGVIDRMPDDPKAAMEEVEILTRLANEWADEVRSSQGLMAGPARINRQSGVYGALV